MEMPEKKLFMDEANLLLQKIIVKHQTLHE